MDQNQLDRIARLLDRISDRSERAEITREIAKVFEDADSSFDAARFYDLANVDRSEAQ
ncbi:MAG TPA: hypothetical protein VFB34_05740 [Chloroflexota bacterium]|nr:hypothetical protein [Chloroflexota bacterium]